MRPQNHTHRFEEIFKTKLQASAVSIAKTLQFQNRQRAKIRLSLNGVMLDEICRRYLRAGKVRATSRLIELLECASSRTSLEATRLVLGIGGIAPPRDGGVQVNLGFSPGYVVNLATPNNTDTVTTLTECGGVTVDRVPRTAIDSEPLPPMRALPKRAGT